MTSAELGADIHPPGGRSSRQHYPAGKNLRPLAPTLCEPAFDYDDVRAQLRAAIKTNSGNLLAEACGVVDPEEDYNEDEMSRKACAVLQIFALESVPEAVFAASFASESDGESCASPEETSP